MTDKQFDTIVRLIETTKEELDNKLSAKIDEVEARLSARIDSLENKIDEVDTRLSAKIDELDNRLSTRIDSLENKIDEVDSKLSAKFDDLSKEIKAVENRLSMQIAELTKVSANVLTEEKGLNDRLVHMEFRISGLEERLDRAKQEITNTKDELMQLIEEKDSMRTRQIQSLNDTIEKRYCRLDKRIKALHEDLNLASAI